MDSHVPVKSWSNIVQCVGMAVGIINAQYCHKQMLFNTEKEYSRVGGELSYLATLDSENFSAPYFKQCFFHGGGVLPPQTESNTTPPSPKTEITNILFYILNFVSIIKFKM